METYKYGWRYWRERDRERQPAVMFNMIGDALDRSVQNALTESKAKFEKNWEEERAYHDKIDLDIKEWKMRDSEMKAIEADPSYQQAAQEWECDQHDCHLSPMDGCDCAK